MDCLARKFIRIALVSFVFLSITTNASQDSPAESGRLQPINTTTDFDIPSVYNFSGKPTSQILSVTNYNLTASKPQYKCNVVC